MSVVLALDTADRTAGVAVAVRGEVRAEVVAATPAQHAERLFTLLDEALVEAGVRRDDLDCVGVTVGPGSFTGLRVGIATAKGIAYALGLPVVAVSSLQALARSAVPSDGLLVPVLDARKGQVYGAAFDGRAEAVRVREGAWGPEELAREVAECGSPCTFLGSGLGPYRTVFESTLAPHFRALTERQWSIPPGQVARLATQLYEAGRGLRPEGLAPVYHRRSEAEEARPD